MSAASLFATCILIWGTTWYAITLRRCWRAPPSPRSAVLTSDLAIEGYDWTRATVIGIALAVAGNVLALHRSVKSSA